MNHLIITATTSSTWTRLLDNQQVLTIPINTPSKPTLISSSHNNAMDITELIPGLPTDLGLECLSRLHYSTHRVALRVCNHWRHLLQSNDFYFHRNKTGHTTKLACLIQAHEQPSNSPLEKSTTSALTPSYDITLYDPVAMTWDRVDPVPEYPTGLPLFSQLATCEMNLILMGGWDPASYEPLTAVFIYDFRTGTWRRGKDMPEIRSFFATGSGHGRVYVAGGHDQNKNALKTAWEYDPKSDEWMELAPMSQERDECEGAVVGDEFWVVSGYDTESQGRFDGSAEVLDIESGQWRKVERVWESGRCPRSCVEFVENGKVVDPGLRVGVCSVAVGLRTLVTGSEYEGGPYGFYLVDNDEGQNRKLRKIDVPDGFSGFVQSGCCVEI